MAGYAVEQIDSRSFGEGDNPRTTLVFKVFGTNVQAEAEAIARAASPVTWGVPPLGPLVRESIQGEPVGPDLWDVDVAYGQFKMGEVGDVEWEFEVGSGGSVHLTTSLETVQKKAASGTAPDFKGALNVKREGGGLLKAQGLDVDDTKFQWSETHYLPYATVNSFSYVNTLRTLRNRTNNGTWRAFAEGEVRFLHARGRAKGQRAVPITFQFSAGPNQTGLTVGGISGVDKKAHEFLWVFHDYDEDATAKALVLRPSAVYVERIFEKGNFDLLGITNPWA